MIEETAQVVASEGRFAWVQTQRTSTCGSCAVNKGCGTATLAKVLGQRRTRVRVLNDVQAGVGEQVIIGLPEQALVRGALAVYLVPLLGLLGGALFGQYLAGRLLLESPDLLSILCGGLGLAAGVFWLRHHAHRIREDVRYQPVIMRRLTTRHGTGATHPDFLGPETL
jgi:sigma-E factor negative regulatory protein RseC